VARRSPTDRTRGRQVARRTAGRERATSTLGVVVTLLTSDERLRVAAAGHALYEALHRESLEEVGQELRRRPVSGVVLSVRMLARLTRRDALLVAELVREFPGVVTVALVCEAAAGMPETVLALGRCGVRRAVDARGPAGWGMLREVLGMNPVVAIERAAIERITADLVGADAGCLRFFRTLFEVPARVSTVRALAEEFGVLSTTLMSRFFRAGLPAPKRYLAMARLVRAARLLENPGWTLSATADQLEYSSAQSFARHVRVFAGVSAAEFRACYDGVAMLERFRRELVLPHLPSLRTFVPFVGGE
jgi:AraC-like DNA-binding protein